MEDWCRRPNKGNVTNDKETVGKAEKGAMNESAFVNSVKQKGLCGYNKIMNFKISKEIILDYLGVPNLIHEHLKAENFLQMEARNATERKVRDLKHEVDLIYLRHRGPMKDRKEPLGAKTAPSDSSKETGSSVIQ